MRTTLNIDDDVLSAVRERARSEKRSSGEVLSELARQAMTRPSDESSEVTIRNGFVIRRSIPGRIVTNEMVNRIREEEGI